MEFVCVLSFFKILKLRGDRYVIGREMVVKGTVRSCRERGLSGMRSKMKLRVWEKRMS